MYVIYRSRFQPEFTEGHKKAVEKFFDIKNKINEERKLVLGIVDEHLLMDLCDQKKLRKNLDKVLLDHLGNNIDTYRQRFIPQLNPTQVGIIKKSIWQKWPQLQIHGLIPYTIVCNAAWTGLSLYERSSEQQAASEYVLRWLPETEAQHIGWYFPIFDRDDINDMGLIANLMAKCFKKDNSDRSGIVFARFNYSRNPKYQYKDAGHIYGFYLKAITEKQKDFRIKENRANCTGMEVPKIDRIPFVYLWSEAISILNEFKELFNWYKTTGNNVSSQTVNQIVMEIDELVERIKHTTSPYADDLDEFYRFFEALPTQLNSCNFLKQESTLVREIVEKVTQRHPSNDPDWLETNLDSGQRVKSIVDKISQKIKYNK